MITPAAYRVYVYGEGYERKLDACHLCTRDARRKKEKTETIQLFGYGTSKHIEDMPHYCDVCGERLNA